MFDMPYYYEISFSNTILFVLTRETRAFYFMEFPYVAFVDCSSVNRCKRHTKIKKVNILRCKYPAQCRERRQRLVPFAVAKFTVFE